MRPDTDVIWIYSNDRIMEFEKIKSDYLKLDATEPRKIECKSLNYPIDQSGFRELL